MLPGDDQLLLAMGQAMADFVAAVASVPPNHWDSPSPCESWSVFDVVDHVVMGDRFAVKILGGASYDQAVTDLVGLDEDLADPAGEVAEAARQALVAFDGSLDRIVDHPVGAIPARRFLGFRVIDQLGHTWDIAQGAKQPIALNPAVVEVGLGVVAVEQTVLRGSDHFETLDGAPPDSQDATDVFLHLIGRRN